MNALLFRKLKNRIKGRDWYDMEWYIRKGIQLNLNHFLKRANETGDWAEKTITPNQIRELLIEKINSISIDHIKEDIIRFIPDPQVLNIWSKGYFLDLVEKLKFEGE